MSGEWWREYIPDQEKVLWFGRPHEGYFPPRVGWAFGILIFFLLVAWLASPWFADTVRDFSKLFGCTVLLGFLMWWDRLIRSRRVYVVTGQNVWWISGIFKPKSLPVTPKLSFYRSGGNIVFSRLRFLVFEYLSDPEAAMVALTQAREASA